MGNFFKSKDQDLENIFFEEGIQFKKPNNKTLRLYFEKQIGRDIDEEDIPLVMHILEIKVFLFYGKHYDKNNLLDIDSLLKDSLDKLQGFSLVNEMVVEQSELIDKFLIDIFKFQYYTEKPEYLTRYKSCNINENLRIKDNIFDNINYLNFNLDFINEISTINSIRIFIKENFNSIFFLFIIKKFLEPHGNNLEKLTVYQVNLSTIDEEIYSILASYLKHNVHITKIHILGKTTEELKYKYDIQLTNNNLGNSKFNSQYMSMDDSTKKKNHLSIGQKNLNFKYSNAEEIKQVSEADPYQEKNKSQIGKKFDRKRRKRGTIKSENSVSKKLGGNENSKSKQISQSINLENINKENYDINIKKNSSVAENSNHIDNSSINSADESYSDGLSEDDTSNNRGSMAISTGSESHFRSDHINKHHYILFYDVLSKKNNLLELKCFIFIKENHLILLSNVLKSNLQLRKLNVRNMITKLNNVKVGELDLSYHFYNSLGTNIKDDFYIFFNQLNQLKELEKLQLIHFNFNSDVNYMACQSSLILEKLKILDLTGNQGIINNYLNVEENYPLAKSHLSKINFGNIYFHMIRCFDLIIHPQNMKIVDMGILDSTSLSSFLHYSSKTNLEKIKLTLNKPCSIDTLELLLKILANHIFNLKKLKYFYLQNTYTLGTYEQNKLIIDEWVNKLFFSISKKIQRTCTSGASSFKKERKGCRTFFEAFVLSTTTL